MTDWPKNEWMDQWQALTRQYWNAFQETTRDAGAATPPSAMPWHEGFEQWSRLIGGAGAQSETIERALASAKSFTAFAQSMIAAATAGQGAVPNWSEALRNGFATPTGFGAPGNFNIPGGASSFANPLAQALREISGQGVKSFEQMMQGFAPQVDPMREAKSWLRVPAFGFMREHQEHYQKMAVALLDYQEQNARYNALIMRASQQGFELFESKLAAREEPGRQIDSLRALYDLWVDAAEEAYAQIALTPEFREVYGAQVNAQMRVRAQIQQEVERMASDFGMPTRSELDSIGQRLHELRREVRNGRSEASGTLAREVESLRREVAALKAAMHSAGATATPMKSRRAAASKETFVAGPDMGKVSAVATKPIERKRARSNVAKKRARPVAALRADIGESVSAPSSAPAKRRATSTPQRENKASAPRVRMKAHAPSHARRNSAQRAPSVAKKSVAKLAHQPMRVGAPLTSFADRIAAFARASQPAKTMRPAGARSTHLRDRSASRGGR